MANTTADGIAHGCTVGTPGTFPDHTPNDGAHMALPTAHPTARPTAGSCDREIDVQGTGHSACSAGEMKTWQSHLDPNLFHEFHPSGGVNAVPPVDATAPEQRVNSVAATPAALASPIATISGFSAALTCRTQRNDRLRTISDNLLACMHDE